MSEVIQSFQSQLTGVMETVFKAAMFEITRLVEESFIKEVSQNREQLETLKKRLQWSESKRRTQELRLKKHRCANCDNGRTANKDGEDTTHTENTIGLKQEKVPDESWKSCQFETNKQERSEDQTCSSNTPESSNSENKKLDCILKEEALYVTSNSKELQDGWTLDSEEAKASDFPSHRYSEQELQQIQDDWSSGICATSDGDPYTDMADVQGLMYRTRNPDELVTYNVHELDMEVLDGAGERTEVSADDAAPGRSVQNDPEDGRRGRSKRASKAVGDGDMHCFFINTEGHLSTDHPVYHQDASDSSTRLSKDHTFSSGVAQVMDHRPSAKALLLSQRANASGPHTCNHCGKKFTQACNLKLHQRAHQREGLHLCNDCGKGFSSYSDLRKHVCSQIGDKPYSCTLCGSKFSRLWNLKLHQRIHTQEKPHKCSMCSKSFTRADILKVHQRTHTGERPYCCGICGLSFKRLDHLRSHQRKHSGHLKDN